MTDVIYVREKAKSVKKAPKYEPIDMVVLYLDSKNFVSSPYVLIDKDEWEESALGGVNGEYTFEYDEYLDGWAIDGNEAVLSEYGITSHFAQNTPQPKPGDKILVKRIADATKSENQDVQLSIELVRSGKKLEANCPVMKASAEARQRIADGILARSSGFRYQPFSADEAEVNPLAELGDAIYVHGVYSGMFEQTLDFNSLMTSDIGAPWKEETDSEYKYETESERRYSRKFAEISSEFEITASEISARVTKTGGNKSSFGWELFNDYFSLSSNDKEVFRVDSTGAHVEGEITATSGFIGSEAHGFRIDDTGIMSGKTGWNDKTNSGIYIGTEGIRLGKNQFSVTNAGHVSASNLTISGGSIDIGNKFKVDSSGNLTATSGKFTGAVYASSIHCDAKDGEGGSFSGAGLTNNSVTGGEGGKISTSGGGLITTANFGDGITTSLGYADTSHLIFTNQAIAGFLRAKILRADDRFTCLNKNVKWSRLYIEGEGEYWILTGTSDD